MNASPYIVVGDWADIAIRKLAQESQPGCHDTIILTRWRSENSTSDSWDCQVVSHRELGIKPLIIRGLDHE